MHKIRLVNNKEFLCEEDATLLQGAEASGINFEYSCLHARCRSCLAKVVSGKVSTIVDDKILTDKERENGFILTCNSKPLSPILLDIEDLSDYDIPESKTFPAKINSIRYLNENVIHLELRLPPNSKFTYLPGQYVNLINGSIRRSYSIANNVNDSNILEFYIKNYKGGEMSRYWFQEAKSNDLLRLEGPKGSFFLKNSDKNNLIFLATGTGIAPVKAILENIKSTKSFLKKKISIFYGARNLKDIIWKLSNDESKINFNLVLSREPSDFKGYRGYVQDAIIQSGLNLRDSDVYACGSDNMIKSARSLLIENGLDKKSFFSDAFVSTN